MQTRELQQVEWRGRLHDPAYLRFSDNPVARTGLFADGEVTVDYDEHGDVVGIEMLSTEPEEWEAVAQIGRSAYLRFDMLLAHAARATGTPPSEMQDTIVDVIVGSETGPAE